MADVAVFFGNIFTPNLMIKKMFFSNKLIFWKNAIFEKSKKIHSDSRKYYTNFRYIIKVRTQKLCEIWIFLQSDARGITIFEPSGSKNLLKTIILTKNQSPCDLSHSHQRTIQKITLHTFWRKKFVRGFFTNKFISMIIKKIIFLIIYV